jgi:hypothetical protein
MEKLSYGLSCLAVRMSNASDMDESPFIHMSPVIITSITHNAGEVDITNFPSLFPSTSGKFLHLFPVVIVEKLT